MRLRLAVLALALSMGACATKTYTIQHPGAVNQVDDRLYGGLLDTRAALEAAKLQIATYPALKDILNTKVIPSFNALESAYSTYHTALVSGQPADATSLQTQLTAVTAALADALKSVGAHK